MDGVRSAYGIVHQNSVVAVAARKESIGSDQITLSETIKQGPRWKCLEARYRQAKGRLGASSFNVNPFIWFGDGNRVLARRAEQTTRRCVMGTRQQSLEGSFPLEPVRRSLLSLLRPLTLQSSQ